MGKRSPNCFLLFCKDMRDEVRKNNPTKTNAEITAELGILWRKVDKNQRQMYINKATKLKEVCSYII